MIELKQFLDETGVKSKVGLAKELGITKQNLQNLIKNQSKNLLDRIDRAFPNYIGTYEEEEIIFHYSVQDQAIDLHFSTREELLEALSLYPAVYSLVAQCQEKVLAYSFESTENKWILFSKYDTGEPIAKFPRAACERFALGMEKVENNSH